MSDPGYTIFDSETGMTALKWGITILVAGFIAQFGKKFATFLIERAKRLKAGKNAAVPPVNAETAQRKAPSPEIPPELSARRADIKFNKKMLKALAKERKKK